MSWSEMPARFGDQFELLSESRDADDHYFRAWIRVAAAELTVTFKTEAENSRYTDLMQTYPERFARRLVEENWQPLETATVSVADIAPSSQFGSQKGFAKVIF